MILSVQASGTARAADPFSSVILNNRQPSGMCLSANISIFLIAALEVGNLFCDK